MVGSKECVCDYVKIEKYNCLWSLSFDFKEKRNTVQSAPLVIGQIAIKGLKYCSLIGRILTT